MKVFKYPLSLSDRTTVKIPRDAKLLRVDLQNNDLYLWALVDENGERIERDILVVGTGHLIDEDAESLVYINTLYSGTFVFHAFELV